MAFIKKLIVVAILLSLASSGAFIYWSNQAIVTQTSTQEQALAFTIAPGSGASVAGQQIATATGVPLHPLLFNLLVRATSSSASIKAGSYELKPGTTPLDLLDQLVRGDFAHDALTIIEGWTFRQMRQAMALHQGIKHDTLELSDQALMAIISPDYAKPEGLFFPDTYLFAKGTSDLTIYKQAHAMLMSQLAQAWEQRESDLPYKNPYQALTMASIIEKETGQESERTMVAGVFVNRLKIGMLLQTDPTVIYGMGENYEGRIRKRDLETDTPYNTYTRGGLPPTPIALPGLQSLMAAMAPAKTDALYFVARGDGTSQFSGNLLDHNRAVNKYQR
jgi:UPF0755 protein